MKLGSFLTFLLMCILGTLWNTDIIFYHRILSGVLSPLFRQSVFCLGAKSPHRIRQLPSSYLCCRLVVRIIGEHCVNCLGKELATLTSTKHSHSHNSSLYWTLPTSKAMHLEPEIQLWSHTGKLHLINTNKIGIGDVFYFMVT